MLKAGDVEEALRLADASRGSKTRTRSIAETLPPTIAILSPAANTSVDSRRLALFYHARSSNLPITKVEARLDGRPAKVLAEAIPASHRGKNEWLAGEAHSAHRQQGIQRRQGFDQPFKGKNQSPQEWPDQPDGENGD